MNLNEPQNEGNVHIEQDSMEETPTPSSMETLLEGDELTLDFPRAGEIRSGIIVSVSDDQILVGVGTKSEGIIPRKDLELLSPEELKDFDVGKEIPVYVVTPEDDQGNLLLSYRLAVEENDWNVAEDLLKSGEVYEGPISGYNKGGLIVNVGKLRGFVPGSQISLSRRMAYSGSSPDQRWGRMVGEMMATRVIEVDRERQRLILSERAALQEARELLKERLLDSLEVGQVYKGRVTSLADFGAFVNIQGADGLVHLTEISWEKISHPSEVLKVGQEINVKVIDIDRDRKRIGLSIRQLQEDPWPEKVADLKVGQLVEAQIVRLVKFGAFARLRDRDVEGLIHISELSDTRIEHPKEVVKEGEILALRVVNIDTNRHRVGLSLRKVDSPQYAHLDWELALAGGLEELAPAEAGQEPETSEAVVEMTPAEAGEETAAEVMDDGEVESALEAETLEAIVEAEEVEEVLQEAETLEAIVEAEETEDALQEAETLEAIVEAEETEDALQEAETLEAIVEAEETEDALQEAETLEAIVEAEETEDALQEAETLEAIVEAEEAPVEAELEGEAEEPPLDDQSEMDPLEAVEADQDASTPD